jgi:hypothetical protein
MKRTLLFFTLVGLGIAVWYWFQVDGYFGKPEFSPDPQVADLQRLQKNIVEQTSSKSGTMPDESQMQAMGEKIRELSDEQRREFFEKSRSVMMGMMEARMKRFFQLPPEEQKKQLDEEIDRMEQARKEGRGGGPFGGGRPGGSARNEAAKDNQASGGSSKADSLQGQRNSFANLSPEERNERHKEMLSHTSPENRALFTEYKTRMDARMLERGIQPPHFP